MDAEQWRKRREALLDRIYSLESGRLSHWDEDTVNELSRDTTEENLVRLKRELHELDAAFHGDASA